MQIFKQLLLFLSMYIAWKIVEDIIWTFFSPLELPMKIEVPKLFAALPEYFIEDIADFLTFINV